MLLGFARDLTGGVRFLGQLATRAAPVLTGLARDLLRPQARLLAENVALRAQVVALKHQVRRAAPEPADRLLLVAIHRLLPEASRSTLVLVRPETLIRWHRDAARWLWAWHSRPKRKHAPRRTPQEIRALVVRMAEENGWGSLRIVGELRQLGIRISRRTVQRILRAQWPEGRPARRQSWETFVRNHLEGTWACDFFTVTTLSFRTLYVFFFLRLDTREVLFANVTAHPTQEWTTQQLRNACWDETPQRLIRDRDGKFGPSFDPVVTGAGGEVLLTPPRQPVANCFAERLVGTLRREVFDHVIPRDEDHARELLRAYLAHYHRRSHQGLELDTPTQRRMGEVVHARDPTDLDLSKLVVTPVLNGLLHEYTLAA